MRFSEKIAIVTGPGHIAYCTSKGAVASFTKSLGRDHAPDGMRVNAVCPHEINTPMLRSGFERRGLDPQDALAELDRTVPLGHVAEPEEIADVMVFLASAEARYVAGETVEVTGAKPWAAETDPLTRAALPSDGSDGPPTSAISPCSWRATVRAS